MPVTGTPMAVLAALAWVCAVPALAGTLAVMPVKLLDTSGEPRDQTAEHARRLAVLGEALVVDLKSAGPWTAAVAVPAQTIAAACPQETAPCLLAAARDAGADQALFAVVQKSSTLILQVFAHVVDVDDAALVASRDLSFRGDTDESWTKMGGFLAHTIAAATGTPAR